MAGRGAERTFNTFLLMEGHLTPPGYGLIKDWRDALYNPRAPHLTGDAPANPHQS